MKLKQTHCKLSENLKNIDIVIDPSTEIPACHCIDQRGTVIVKFSNRLTLFKIKENKHKTRDSYSSVYMNEIRAPINGKLEVVARSF